MAHPQPRKAAESHFQAASPVNAEGVRIRMLPAIPLRNHFADIAFLPGETPGLGERGQMLMPIQFPDDFVIANFGEVEKLNLKPGLKWGALAAYWIHMPIALRAIIEVRATKQRETKNAN